MAINKMAGSLQEKFAAYREQLQGATAELRSVQARIGERLAERRSISCMQCTRDEFLAAMFALVDRQADIGSARRTEMLGAWSMPPNRSKPRIYFQPQQFTWLHAQAVAAGSADFGGVGLPFLFGNDPSGSSGGPLADAPSVCLVLGDAIKEGLRKYMAGVPWPEEITAGERSALLAKIDAELAALRGSEAELITLIGDNSIKAIEDL